MLGQSFDTFVLLPFTTFESMYGRRKTTVISVKMHEANAIDEAMSRAEEAMRLAHRLRPGEDNDFTVDKAAALVAFWGVSPGCSSPQSRRWSASASWWVAS